MARTPDRIPPAPLPPMRPEQASRLLSPPWIPTMLAPAIGRACRARALVVPVHFVLPSRATGMRFARALHAVTGPAGDLLVATDPRAELRLLPLGATLVVDPAVLDVEGQLALEALLDDGEVWVIALGDADTPLPASLADRLSAVVVDVPPLARRQLELPALSTAILQTLAQRAGRSTPALAPAARTRLASHPWPGDLVELETVLGRALASTEAATLDVAALGWDVGGSPDLAPVLGDIDAVALVEAPAAPSPTPTIASAGEPEARLAGLLAELAHEMLNPLSTVKMLMDHLPQLLQDAEARETLSKRASEAVDRVDGLLQNVMEYARLGPPSREAVSVGPLLDRLLREAAPELAERAVRVRRTGADVECIADPAQLEYGLRNLLAGVVREVPPRDEFLVDTARNGVVAVRFAAGKAAAARLRALLADDGRPDLGDPSLLPLSFTLARAVLERNGGSLAVRDDAEGPTTLIVRLPVTQTD